MKYLSKIITLFFLSVLSTQALYAQDNIDANRMNRDINIMENILQELFKTRWEAQGNTVHVKSTGIYFGSRSSDIRGTYLPGYGIIFTIPGGPPGFVSYSDSDEGKSYSYTFRYSDDASSGKTVSEESITQRIREFLREYGSTIGQLSENDRIMVIYNTQQHIREFPFFHSSDDQKKQQLLPTISVVAQMKDLQAYRSGNLSKDQLDQRLSISKSDAETNDRLDLKVMANIFETALKEQEGPAFRISGSINYLNLDNFGALFFFDSHYSSRSGSFFFDMPKISSFSFNDEEGKARVEVQRALEAEMSESRKQQEETTEEIKQGYDTFINSLKEYLVDYGRTLSSVKANQHILISASISSSIDEIPERVDLQIKKSVLEAMDKGNTSRDEAMSQIVVREY